MSMSSICRRLVSGKIASFPILGRRNFCTATTTDELLRPAAAPPCLMLPPHFIGGGGRDMVYNFYSPTNDKVVSLNNRGGEEETRLMQDDKTKVVGSSHGWLALYNSRNRGMFLSNPVSGRLIDLPPLAGKPFSGEATPQKLVMSCPPEDEECRAVLIYGDSAEHVAFCCPGQGRGSSQWAPLDSGRRHLRDSHSRMFPDFVYSAARKRFVALVYYASPQTEGWHFDDEMEVEYWDISESSCPRMDGVESPWKTFSGEPHPVFSYIVCAGAGAGADQLILVTKRMPKVAYEVLGLENNDANAEYLRFYYHISKIEDGGGVLNDLTVFVGLNHSIAFPSPKFPKLKLIRDGIYYADPRWNSFCKGQYIETFDNRKRTYSPIYFPNRYQKIEYPMIWITPTFN